MQTDPPIDQTDFRLHLCEQMDIAVEESETAVDAIVKSFMIIGKAAEKLSPYVPMSKGAVTQFGVISSEIATLVESLQYQDRLKQRLEYVGKALRQEQEANSGQNPTTLFRLVDDHPDENITLFDAAA